MNIYARLRRGIGSVALVLSTGAIGCASSAGPTHTVGPRSANPSPYSRMAPLPPAAPAATVRLAPTNAPATPPSPVAILELPEALAGLPGLVIPPPYTQRTAPVTPYNPEPDPAAAIIAANDPRVTMARNYAREHQIRVDVWHDRFTSNATGRSAAIAGLADGGVVLVGTRDAAKSTGVVVRLDAQGRKQWERGFARYAADEGRSLLATNGGILVHVASFLSPARAPFHRFVQLEADGALRWERRLRGDGGANTPHPQFMRETPHGTYTLKGHIYRPGAPETPWAWDGELDRNGHLLRDQTGDFDPYQIANQTPSSDIWL